jgi:putative ABC transport system ATP-binding protein
MVTHDPRIAAYADRIVFLKDGAIVDETVLDPTKSANTEKITDKMHALV